MRRNPLANMKYPGGIISGEFLENMRLEEVKNKGVEPKSFATFDGGVPKNKKALEEQILETYNYLVEKWDNIRKYEDYDVTKAREKWLLPLFRALGFDPLYNQKAVELDRKGKMRFFFSHRGWSSLQAPPIHTVPLVDLEQPYKVGGHKRSPHDEVQAYLNASTAHKWGIVTNGLFVRILRDYHHTYTKGYVQFDLDNILQERQYNDFRAFYRITHASRFLPDDEGETVLERFYEQSKAAGVKVGQDLRGNVIQALESLGNGFLHFNTELREKLEKDSSRCQDYYVQVLRVIYRMLFLLYAEQRGMLPPKGIYIEEYSMVKLRELAETASGNDNSKDLWEGLKATFQMVKTGVPFPDPKKEVFGYNGLLFEDSQIKDLLTVKCRNQDLLSAVKALTVIEKERITKRINYIDLGVEEIGSIYESLLDFTPRVTSEQEEVDGREIPAHRFFLDPRGTARKTTGSYYTNPALVNELIKSALIPVLEDKLEKGADDPEGALLSMKVCDPACGSGAFLIAATQYLGRRLAQMRTEQEEPSQDELQQAMRDVLQHCIYGVDLNPMAVELAKVSLWIVTSVKDLPLNFLDHHIKCGNSLIGATPELLEKPLPDKAFDAKTGDDKAVSRRTKALNKAEKKDHTLGEFITTQTLDLSDYYEAISDMEERRPEDVDKKKERYDELRHEEALLREKFLADAWTAAFFWPMNEDSPTPPTQGVLRRVRSHGPQAWEPESVELVNELASKHRFFHWYLEFPDVFHFGGYDTIIGNPPWERIKLQEKEWFMQRAPNISNAKNASTRRKLITELAKENIELYLEFESDKRSSDCQSFFVRMTDRYPLCGRGDVNLYAIFAEGNRNLLNHNGLFGCILPTGIATDDTTKLFFQDLITEKDLRSLYDFENKKKLFPDVAPPQKFCCITAGRGKPPVDNFPEFAFFLHTLDELEDSNNRFTLSTEDIALLNPNTNTCPIFRKRHDAVLTKYIYKRVGILIKEGESEDNPWGIKFNTMFHMANDSHLFNTYEELEEKGYKLIGNKFCKEERYFPLYEAKMFHHYDYRYNTYKGVPISRRFKVKAYALPVDKTKNNEAPLPRYWIKENDVLTRWPFQSKWCFTFRDVTNVNTNRRTAIFSIIPQVGIAHKAPILFPNSVNSSIALGLYSSLSSFIFDYCVRQSLGGTSLSYFILKQTPSLRPNDFIKRCLWAPSLSIIEWLKPRVIELLYTSHDLKPMAQECGYNGPPYKWDEKRRLILLSEIDAAFFHLFLGTIEEWQKNGSKSLLKLFPTPGKAVNYILNTFPIIKKKDIGKYDYYKTKENIMDIFNRIQKSIEIDEEYQSKLKPPPAHPEQCVTLEENK